MTDEQKIVTFSELVLRPCEHTYGVAPCMAELGVTGEKKCYNSPRTCQDPANFSAGADQIIRWAEPTEYLDSNAYDFIPSQVSVQTRTQVISPGESLGERESVTVSYKNHRHNDVGFDKYIADRGFNTYETGTFWGKFRARWPNIAGCEFRIVRGHVGQHIDEMERRHYVVENASGPTNKGAYQITAKDALKVLDGDKAQAPAVSGGVLSVGIDESATAITLEPAGVGDLEYPAEGLASIGDEMVSYTRAGDVITLTARGLRGSEIDAHDDGETFQQALIFDAVEPSQILFELLSNYTSIPAEYLDLPAWNEETTQYIGRLYSAEIMKPTSVKTLCDELIQQVGLIVHTNVIDKKIDVKAMRAFIPQMSLSDDNYLVGSISSTPEANKRTSLVLTYYGQKNPLEKIDEEKNYRGILASADDSATAAIENLTPAIRKIYSRWITIFNRPAAQYINSAILARYGDAPRKISMQLPLSVMPRMGAALSLSSRIFEDDQGLPAEPITAQIIAVEKGKAFFSVMAEELSFVRQAVGDRVINIDADSYNINVRTVHDGIYTPASEGDNVLVVVAAGVNIGSLSSSPALDIGGWPDGVNITVQVLGRIQGKGGDGGLGGSNPADYRRGGNGGTALYTRYPITIDNATGEIFGGGGGGGGRYWESWNGDQRQIGTGAGGGGAGNLPGAGSGGVNYGGMYSSPAGTRDAGGNGVSNTAANGGDGGGPGENGERGAEPGGESGGTKGMAVDGNSYVTWTNEGDIRGNRFN